MGKIDRIKISAEFHVAGNGMWLSAECPVAPEENEVEEFKKVRDVLFQSFNGINPGIRINPEYAHLIGSQQETVDPIVDQEITARFEETKRLIRNAKTLEEKEAILVLSEFKFNLELRAIVRGDA